MRRRRSKNRKGRGERGREGEREILLTIKKTLKVGKHNALSGGTAPGRTGSSIDGEYSTPTLRLAIWPAWRVGKHKGAQTAIGPSGEQKRKREERESERGERARETEKL